MEERVEEGVGSAEHGTADFRDARTTRANSRRSEILRPSWW